MPRGRGRGGGKSHKGQRRVFSNPEKEEEERLKNQKAKAWNKSRGNESDESSEEDEGATADRKRDLPPRDMPESESSDEETDSEDEESRQKPIGVSHLIEIENPNRVQKKTKKVSDLDPNDGKPELSRREREALEKERAQKHYEKLKLQGKTEEARSDLARLAIIKKQREDAARRREQEKAMKEETKAKK